MMWPRYCPVCGEELPVNGNRRLRVPGRGTRLVHAGACAEAIDAQQVLDLTPPAGMTTLERAIRLSRRWYVLGRRRISLELAENVRKGATEPVESYFATHWRAVADRLRVLVRDEEQQLARQRGQEWYEIARRRLLHERKVCVEDRTELFA